MAKIFDLSRIAHLVKDQHPTRILLMDTNVLMNEPNPRNWSVSAGGATVFVLSDSISLELEYVRQKQQGREKDESRDKAVDAIKSLAELFKRGVITDGIAIESGWVISVPSPKRDALEGELEQLDDIVKAFKRSDTKLLLLTKECHELFQSLPVALITGESNLFNIAQMNGVPCNHWSSFPLVDLRDANAVSAPVNWEKVLSDIQGETREKSITVELTLTSQRSAPPWVTFMTTDSAFTVAEGQGCVRHEGGIRPFLWTVSFLPHTLAGRSDSSEKSGSNLPSIHLDFLGQPEPGQDLFDAIADRIWDCTSLSLDEDRPSLQSPESVMEILLYLEYIDKNGVSEDAIQKLRREIDESEGITNYWAAWVLDKEEDLDGSDERFVCLEMLLSALRNCWKAGQTYAFSVVLGQEGPHEPGP